MKLYKVLVRGDDGMDKVLGYTICAEDDLPNVTWELNSRLPVGVGLEEVKRS